MIGRNLKKLTEKKPRLFYYELAVDAWIPVPEKIEHIIDLESHFGHDGEVVQILFKRLDLSDLEMEDLKDE